MEIHVHLAERMKTHSAPNYDDLVLELHLIEQWESDYYRKKSRLPIERHAHEHRKKRRSEILGLILEIREQKKPAIN